MITQSVILKFKWNHFKVFLKKNSYKKCITDEKVNIRQVISTIEEGGLRIALILNNKNKLIGTICDGDIRRGLLKGLTLESSITSIIRKNFIKASPHTSKKDILYMLKNNAISQIPILDEEANLVGLEISEDLLPSSSKLFIPNVALLMAGGRGKRLKPITNYCPKPLLPINGKPILEIILEQCINYGIKNFYISVNYLAEKIIDYFGDGSKWNVSIKYLEENKPLGTAGALHMLPKDIKNPILLINGDVLTKTNFKDILKYHEVNSGDITICAREHLLNSPYGVIEVDGIYFKSMIEKPSFRQLVNAGVYVINSDIIRTIEPNHYFDMPDLIERTKKQNNRIIVYPIHEYWLDVGKPESLNQAENEWSNILRDL